MNDITLKLISIEKPDEMNFILGQTHFIKSVEDLYEAIVNTVPNAKFGIAFCEASGTRKVRSCGNDEKLKELAEHNALALGAGHSFIIFMQQCFPLHILNSIKMVPEVCSIFCATSNPTKVLIAETQNNQDTGRGILGVIDGHIPKGIENTEDRLWRKKFLRDIGYKL
ncbi:MAG: adenosine-specific kinase [Thermoplasmatota archaeon]|jgi:adenosine/AMP kinase